MANKNIHLLSTGDLHLGRHPARIPEEYDSHKFSPVFIWEKIIKKALELEIDCLLITGDIIDRDNRYYEAYGPFEAGLMKLADKNISVFAVAGNHDYDVLPDLARNIDASNFHLLGTGGKWESETLKKNDKPVLNLLGWSYPSRRVRKNPVDDIDINFPNNDLPVIALLHCELNNKASNYAPVSIQQLEETSINAWFLGHIHKSNLISKRLPLILNTGSPQPLHPAEQGIHGIWEVIIKQDNNFEIEKHTLSSLQYMNIEIDVFGLDYFEDLTALISTEIEEKLDNKQEIRIPDLIITRIIIKGRTELNKKINMDKNKLLELEFSILGCRVIIDKIINQTRPVVDIEDLAASESQAGLIADYLLKLESGNNGQLPESLLKNVKKKILEVYNSNAYQPLRKQNRISKPGKEEMLSMLKKQAKLLLESLIEQKEDAE